MLLQRLSDSAHRRIIGPQVESTPALGRAAQHWPTAVERLYVERLCASWIKPLVSVGSPALALNLEYSLTMPSC